MSARTLERILEHRIISIIRGVSARDLPALAGALRDGGIRCLEIAFDHSGAEDAAAVCRKIETLSRIFGDEMLIGAGTALTTEEARMAAAAGAKFIISPNVDPAVIRAAKEAGLASVPGAMTPSEALTAFQCGADIIKLFPADILGPAYIRAFRGPLPHIPVIAVGGITPRNIKSFFAAGAVGAGVGGGLANQALVDSGAYESISDLARQYTESVK
ncbi:MAG: bifunctional 4-hydroxy-2-oxoglutarate aldolase/2-dehydro-3-deoxy-phosphogluconate aldolase [Gracilibacteraceae bacterium]|nr:bifunctional 4-hydroxy-2-oxoglutarate aldolase/2-dehydro-3-deoxy-phosphogluconate aldolase [Gracilibacteraceae bacterium]